MNPLLEPFTYGYMVNALVVCALTGGLCGLISCYLMLKGWSLMGDALAHAMLPGVAVAAALKLPFVLGALVAGVLAAGAVQWLSQRPLLKPTTAIGLVFTSFFALGLFILSLYPSPYQMRSVMLGDVLSLSAADSAQMLAISALAMGLLVTFRKILLVCFFDEGHARALGLNPSRVRLGFLVLLAAVIVAALKAVGAVLVVCLLMAPGATAYLLTDRFTPMCWIAVAIGAGTSVGGAYLSFFVDGATGGLIVVLQALTFATAFVFAPKHGVLASLSTRGAAGEC